MKIIFDIETTGLDPSKDQITEIGALLVEGGNVIQRFSRLVSIEGEVPKKIVELTGITDDMLKGQPKIGVVLEEFLEFIKGYPLLAHNAGFDIGFIQTKLKENGFGKIENEVYDTLILSRDLLKTLQKHNLGALAHYLSIENTDHHRAINDCEVLHEILLILEESLRRQGRDMEYCKIK